MGRFDTPRPEPIYGLNELLPVVRSFVAGRLNAGEFARQYMRMFQDSRIGNETVFAIMDNLFFDAEEYYDDRDPDFERNPQAANQLAMCARKAIESVERTTFDH